ncbi:MAG: sensor of ECF-type sigma factor, partial [bacterium]|nr:sensor of ECF-type sigma factor [bacterium]
MKLKKLFPILLLLISFSFYGQGEKMREKKEQIKALKVAFLTTELKLTSNEAEKFWPVYNTFDD